MPETVGRSSEDVGPFVWTDEQRDFVEAQQARAYGNLGESLGLGGDPKKAYSHLAGVPMPLDHVSPEKFRSSFGLGASYFTPQQWAKFNRDVPDIYQRYFSHALPTPYENPNNYPLMKMIFDGAKAALGRQGQVLIPQPLLATLPSGDVNAKVEREPDTNVPIVFFEQGLFKFLYGFSLLISWAVPPLSPQQLSDDSALALLARTYTIPVQASEFFGGILYEYVVSGTPTVAASSIGGRVENVFLSIALLTQMERFVMIHELSHLALGHLSESRRDSDWEYEFEADAAACDMVTDATHTEFGSWAVGFWACDLALTALHFLDRTLGLLAFGHANLRWISETHPPALNRRARLRERIGSIGPEPPSEGIAAAGELLGMSDAIFQRLWEISSPLFLISRSQQGVRPLPMWNERIKRSFEEKG